MTLMFVLNVLLICATMVLMSTLLPVPAHPIIPIFRSIHSIILFRIMYATWN